MFIKTGLLHVPRFDEEASLAVRDLLQQAVDGCFVTLERTVGSQRHWVEETLRVWCDEEELDLLLTIGGTYPASGPSPDEIVPEATLAVVERLVPGLSESMRAVTQVDLPLALLDRGVSGIRGRTLIVNLPAGAQPAALFLDAIVDLIEPLSQHLQQSAVAPRMEDEVDDAGDRGHEDQTPSSPTVQPSPKASTGLDADEFAAFLRRDEE